MITTPGVWAMKLAYMPPVATAYVVSDTNSIQAITVSEAKLTLAGKMSPGPAAAGSVTSIRVNAAGKNLYAGGGTTLYPLTIQANGSLAPPVTAATLTIPSGDLTSLAITPFTTDPNALYALIATGGDASARRITATGTALSDQGTVHLGSFWGARPYVHPDGLVLYSHHTSPNRIHWANITRATGALGPIGAIDVPAGLYAKPTVMNLARTYLYIAGTTGVHYVQATPATGAITNPLLLATGWVPRNLAIHPSGGWLYVSGADGAIHRFSVAAGVPSGDTAYASTASVDSLVFASPGVLLSVSPAEHKVVAWQVNATSGALTKFDEVTVTAPTAIEAVAK